MVRFVILTLTSVSFRTCHESLVKVMRVPSVMFSRTVRHWPVAVKNSVLTGLSSFFKERVNGNL